MSCKKDVGEDVQCDYSPGKVTLVTEQAEGLVLSWLDREFEDVYKRQRLIYPVYFTGRDAKASSSAVI